MRGVCGALTGNMGIGSMRLDRALSAAAFLVLCISLSACVPKKGPDGVPPVQSGVVCQDVIRLPQDLNAYAASAGGGRALVQPSLQTASAADQKDRLYRPWRMTEPTRWVKQSLNKNFNMKPDNAYTGSRQPFPMDAWQQIVANSNKEAYPSGVARAITLRHTDLRAMPTTMPFYLDPDRPGEGFPFDYFQHTSLPIGTPLFICNVSKDGQWLLAETALTAGWVPAKDVAEVDDAFIDRWQSRPLAALLRDRVSLAGGTEHIGTLLPLAGAAPQGRGHALSVFYPLRGDNGKAAIGAASLGSGDAALVPLVLTPAEVAKVGNEMMGQAYGWGGLAGRRDCSALTRDLFAPFGIWLPRNSSRQAKVGTPIPLAGYGSEEKESLIASRATPFLSLIWLPGHIGVYLGQYQGKPVMFHNVWGLRTRGGDSDCGGRAVIGKAVVTTLRPGAERPDICSPASILDRVQRATVLPGVDAAFASDSEPEQ